jgi:hypothetical protein
MNTTTATVDAAGIADRYIAFWNETDAARRQRMLEAGWSDDACYIDPLMQARGHAELNTLVGGVHERFPGFRFARLGQADAHGDNVRFSWKLGPSGDEDMIQGTDFVQLHEGKLRSVTGFLDKVPAGA